MVDGRHIENHFLAITQLHIARLRRNLDFGGIIAHKRRLDDENDKFQKSNMADGRHFENHYISISQPQIVRISRNLVCGHKFYPRRGNVTKKSEIPKFKMADGRHIENHFFAYNSVPLCPIKMIFLKFGGTIARTRRLPDENVQFRKCNMADGRHFENHCISISQPQLDRISRNLVCRHKFYPRRGNVTKKIRNSQIQDGGRTPY